MKLRYWAIVLLILASPLILAACASDSKEAVLKESLECWEERDPIFEETLLRMFATAEDLDDAKNQYIYVSQAASLDELKAARDEMCEGNPDFGRLRGGPTGSDDSTPGSSEGRRTAMPQAANSEPSATEPSAQGSARQEVSSGGDLDDHAGERNEDSATVINFGQTIEGNIDHPVDEDVFLIVNDTGGRCRIKVASRSGSSVTLDLYRGGEQHSKYTSQGRLAGIPCGEWEEWAVVSAAEGEIAPYSLSIEVDDCAGRHERARRVFEGETVGGTIFGNVDAYPLYCFHAEEGFTYQIDVNGSNSNTYWVTLESYETIIAAAKEFRETGDITVDSLADGEGMGQATLLWQAKGTGIHYIKVGIYESNESGRFLMELSSMSP